MQNKFGGCSSSTACRFSEAYVIAHEVGHHVQDELGILPRVTQAQQAASSQTAVNALQVRIELQADCFAGVWANLAPGKHKFLDPGDVDQALQTATAIGDDRLQKETQGYVVPDSFTHGTSVQRKRWFMNGFNGGQVLGLRYAFGEDAVEGAAGRLQKSSVRRTAGLECAAGKTQAPLQAASVQALCNTRRFEEIARGQSSVTNSPKSADIVRLLVARGIRGFGDGFAAIFAARLSDGDRFRHRRDRHCGGCFAARLGAVCARRPACSRRATSCVTCSSPARC